MASLKALMVSEACIEADDVEEAITDKDHGDQFAHGNLDTLPSLRYPATLISILANESQ